MFNWFRAHAVYPDRLLRPEPKRQIIEILVRNCNLKTHSGDSIGSAGHPQGTREEGLGVSWILRSHTILPLRSISVQPFIRQLNAQPKLEVDSELQRTNILSELTLAWMLSDYTKSVSLNVHLENIDFGTDRSTELNMCIKVARRPKTSEVIPGFSANQRPPFHKSGFK